MKEAIIEKPRWLWWTKGECVVEVLRRGHYPTTAMVRLPNDKETEVELEELENHQGVIHG
jgi:hypothetical protein